MNTWHKSDDGTWLIKVQDASLQQGASVVVTKRNGQTERYTLGAFVSTTRYGERLFGVQRAQQQEDRLQYNLGSMDKLTALFDRAARHLRFPGVALAIPGTEYAVRVTPAREPGSLNVYHDSRHRWARKWYGCITPDGKFNLAPGTPMIIASRLAAFAKDPAKIAGEHGHLTGRCCFCRLPLDDERSTAVGYGPVCANHYGLPWGNRPAEFAGAA